MQPVVHHTFVTERAWDVPVARVFAAFSDPERKKRWYGSGSESFEMEFRVGGAECLASRLGPNTPFPGGVLANQGTILDIVEGERVVIASSMWLEGRPISASLCTWEFIPEGEGARLIFTHQGAYFEGSDGPDIREAGWNVILRRLDVVLRDAVPED